MTNPMKTDHKTHVAHQLHSDFVTYGANAKLWMRKCMLLLPEIDRHQIWKQKGFTCIYEYAAKLAGMNRDTVNDALRILKKTENMPEIRKVIELKGMSAIKPIENLVTPENEKFWAEKAQIMSKHTLETFVKEIRKIDEFQRPGTLGNNKNPHEEAISIFNFQQTSSTNHPTPHKKIVAMELEPEIIAQLEKLKGSNSWNDLIKNLLHERTQQLAEQKPEPVPTNSRHIPKKIQAHVLHKTNNTCSFPGCNKPYKILHHTQRFALKKIHDPNQLEPLCKNHERLAHLGLIENENQPAPKWRIRTQPNKQEPKYKIDMLVSKYRNNFGNQRVT